MKDKRNVKKTIVAASAAAVVIAAALFAFFVPNGLYERFFAPEVPLKIISSPVDITVENGYSAVFEVGAQGNGLSYSWEYTAPDGTKGKIKGSVGSRLSLVTDMSMNGNVYRCTVTDRNGEKQTAEEAKLTVTKEHTYGEMLVTKENTCLESGEATYVCSSCGDKKTEALPAKGHDFNESVSYTGKRLFVCRVCSYSFETDAADKSALDAALKKIPDYVSVYYDGTAAKSLASLRDKLNSTVYGVKNYDLLSQKETNDYAERINSALKGLTLRTSSGKNIYLTSRGGSSAELSATDGKTVSFDSTAVSLTDAECYAETKKKAYYLTLPDGEKLFSSESDNILLQSCAEDPTLLRTAVVYNCADRLGISEAPYYNYAELWLDGEYLGAYIVRDVPPEETKNAEELKNELIEIMSSSKSYNEIKTRVDTARFSRFMLLYCVTGLADSVNTDSLLFEDDGKISIHVPYLCDGILRSGTAPTLTAELQSNDILASLSGNADFMKETRNVYALCRDKLNNLCRPEDAAVETETQISSEESTTEEKSTVPDASPNNTNAAYGNNADGTERAESDISSYARLREKYDSIIERNFAEGAVTYSDSFGRLTRYTTLNENAYALASALRARLSAAASYFG